MDGRSRKWLWTLLLIVMLSAAACGNDGDKPANTPEPTAETGTPSGGLSLEGGVGLNVGAGGGIASGLPGCADPSDEECPIPLVMDLDGEIAADGVSVRYPDRYFDAAPGEGAVLFTITPSENNRFAERAVFEARFAESVEAALAALTEPETAEWAAGALAGTISVVRDEAQDPPVSTTVGAFALDDGRAVVLTLTTTGKYGWDLWSQVYVAMLDTLAVSAP